MPSPFHPVIRLFNSVRRRTPSPALIALLLALLVFAVVLLLRQQNWLEPFELYAYDTWLGIQARQAPRDERITLLWLTDEEQRRWGWPLPDGKLVQILQRLRAEGAAVIGLDIYRDNPVPFDNPDFPRLEALLRADQPAVIGIFKYPDNHDARQRVDALPALNAGFNDVLTDPPESMVRRGLLFMDDGAGNHHSYFALQLADRYLRTQAPSLGLRGNKKGDMLLGGSNLSLLLPPLPTKFGPYAQANSGGYQFLLRYPGAPDGFHSIRALDLLNGAFDPRRIRDKIVIIGTASEATPDFILTPVAERMPGAQLHAYNLSQLLRLADGQGQTLQSVSEIWERAWILLAALSAALLCLQARSLVRLVMLGGGGLLLWPLLGLRLFLLDYWLPVAAPLLAWVMTLAVLTVYLIYHERRNRQELMRLFSRHVSTGVANVLWNSRAHYLHDGYLRPRRLTATVLFTDLQNFTTLSENMEPQQLMQWLNEYMDAMVRIVEQHQGQVNKFIGDAIMAVFGVPEPSVSPQAIAADARNAVNCALAMREEMLRLQKLWYQRKLPPVRMRIGICTGPLVAGTLGSAERQEYTVLGDTVNTASRLESYDKNLETDNPCRILISDATARQLGNEFCLDRVGTVKLKGKINQITIYLVKSYQALSALSLPERNRRGRADA